MNLIEINGSQTGLLAAKHEITRLNREVERLRSENLSKDNTIKNLGLALERLEIKQDLPTAHLFKMLIRIVCKASCVTPEEIASKCQAIRYVVPRAIIVKLWMSGTGESCNALAKREGLGGRDRTTLINLIGKLKDGTYGTVNNFQHVMTVSQFAWDTYRVTGRWIKIEGKPIQVASDLAVTKPKRRITINYED